MVVNTFPAAPLTGNGFIAGEGPGIVTVAGAPAIRRVNLMVTAGQVIRSTISDAGGTYRFDRIAADRRYVVMAFDHQLVYNAVIRDNVTPAPMP